MTSGTRQTLPCPPGWLPLGLIAGSPSALGWGAGSLGGLCVSWGKHLRLASVLHPYAPASLRMFLQYPVQPPAGRILLHRRVQPERSGQTWGSWPLELPRAATRRIRQRFSAHALRSGLLKLALWVFGAGSFLALRGLSRALWDVQQLPWHLPTPSPPLGQPSVFGHCQTPPGGYNPHPLRTTNLNPLVVRFFFFSF